MFKNGKDGFYQKNFWKEWLIRNWEDEGRPDGEQLIQTLFGKIKIKDDHWMRAEAFRDFDLMLISDLELILGK